LLINKILHSHKKYEVTASKQSYTGADPGGGGGTPGARPSPKIGKNKIIWRKIVIFHTKYPKNVRASLRSAQLF
jgi:hypothetical protein